MPSAFSGGWPRILAWAVGVCLPLASIIIILNVPLRDPLLDSTGIGKPFSEPTHAVRSPEDVITVWQWMTVSWMAPLIRIGYKRQLHNEDVWLLKFDMQHTRLHMLFREVSGTVLARLLKANGPDLLITATLGILEMLIDLAEPVLLKQLLGALTLDQPNIRTAIVYAAITLFARLVKTQSGVFNLWYCRRTYARSRGELITMVHEKMLRRKAFTIPSTLDVANNPTSQHPDSPIPGISTATTLTDDVFSTQENDDDNDSDTSGRPKLQKFKSLLRRGYTKLNRRRFSPPPTPPPQEPTTAPSPASTGRREDALERRGRLATRRGSLSKPQRRPEDKR
jgi:hypothetical protein